MREKGFSNLCAWCELKIDGKGRRDLVLSESRRERGHAPAQPY